MNSTQLATKKSPSQTARESRAIGESAEGGDGGGQPCPIYDGVTTTTITGRATHESGQMSADMANVLTAVATMLTTLVLILEYRARIRAQAPKLRLIRVDAPHDGWHLVFFRIYPGVEPTKFVQVKASKAHLAMCEWKYDTAFGEASSHRVPSPESSLLAVDVQVDASGEGAKPVEIWLYIKFTSASSTRISLKRDRRFLEVRYSISTDVSNST